MDLIVRDAAQDDAPAVVRLLLEHSAIENDPSQVTAAYAASYLASSACKILLAEVDGEAIGLLSYSVRGDLYHAGPVCLIEELIVRETARRRGVGTALMDELLARTAALGCVELSVAVMPSNPAAAEFYRAHGLVEEILLLERHFGV